MIFVAMISSKDTHEATAMDCKFCNDDHYPQGDMFGSELTGRVIINYDSGMSYDIPANLPHLIVAHSYQPPRSLITDVMNSRQVTTEMVGAVGKTVKVELDEYYSMGQVPLALPSRLYNQIKRVQHPETTT